MCSGFVNPLRAVRNSISFSCFRFATFHINSNLRYNSQLRIHGNVLQACNCEVFFVGVPRDYYGTDRGSCQGFSEAQIGSFSFTVGGISESRHPTVGVIPRLHLFKQNGKKSRKLNSPRGSKGGGYASIYSW